MLPIPKDASRQNIENRTEDMVFVVEPKTWFLTNWNLRNALSIDYKYECKVVFTTYVDGNAKKYIKICGNFS